MRTLFAGPYFGEFGHEVLGTGLLRAHARNFDRVIVCSRPGCKALYAGIAHEFRPHFMQGVPMCDRMTRATMPSWETIQSHVEPGCDRFPMPNCGSGYTEEQIIRLGHYIHLGTARDEFRDSVVFHARARSHEPGRNWPQAEWNRLAEWVVTSGIAKRVICVGTSGDALLAEGAYDMRGEPLEAQMDIGASALCAVGPSSGWMHLASLCYCPHLTWVGGKEHVYVKRRYVDRWNPLRTRAQVLDEPTWQPTFETVRDGVSRFVRSMS